MGISDSSFVKLYNSNGSILPAQNQLTYLEGSPINYYNIGSATSASSGTRANISIFFQCPPMDTENMSDEQILQTQIDLGCVDCRYACERPPEDCGINQMVDLPYEPALPEDTRYRDMCIATGNLRQEDFQKTVEIQVGNTTQNKRADDGQPNAPDLPILKDWVQNADGSWPPPPRNPDRHANNPEYETDYKNDTQFSQKYTGNVLGAKPPLGTCMPVKDTPITPVDDFANHPDKAFAYFLNRDNEPFLNDNKGYIGSTFFIGGLLGCPDLITLTDPITGTPDQTRLLDVAQLNRLRAKSCYNYYVLQRSLRPWFQVERPSRSGTDDPLTIYDPNRAYLNNCQPLVRGDTAEKITEAYWATQGQPGKVTLQSGEEFNPAAEEKSKGFAPVLRYEKRPDMDEDEYTTRSDQSKSLSKYLARAWDSSIVSVQGDPDNSDGKFTMDEFYLSEFLGENPNPFKQAPGDNIGLPCTQAREGAATDEDCDIPRACGVDIPSYIPYNITNPHFSETQVQYCPNVERIVEPSHPFSPRHDISTGANGRSYKTDREYSAETSKHYEPDDCGPEACGYSDYLSRCDINETHPTGEYEQKFPAVQCALVPVDILDFRKEQFDNCIMQRINLNIAAWNEQPPPKTPRQGVFHNDAGFAGGRSSTFTPPCSTRFWEADQGNCKAKLSIQQCCRIIVKDVVPANFLKIRTAEGLKELRREAHYEPGQEQQLPQGSLQRYLQIDQNLVGRTPMALEYDPNAQARLAPSPQERLESELAYLSELVSMAAQAAPSSGNITIGNPPAGSESPIITPTGPSFTIGNPDPDAVLNSSSNPFYTPLISGAFDTIDVPSYSACQVTRPAYHDEFDSNIVNITDQDFGFAVGGIGDRMDHRAAYIDAYKANLALNAYVLSDEDQTEPPEYRFRHYDFRQGMQSFNAEPQPLDNPFHMNQPYSEFIAFPEEVKSRYLASKLGYNMPYMRWWDTGVSAGNKYHGGSFVNTLGGWDVIIGVGREERDKTTAETLSHRAGRLCSSDGGRLGSDQPSQMGRVGGWSELKAHQMWSVRRSNLACLARYETVFKPGSAENLVHAKAGAGYISMLSRQFPWSLGWRGYVTDSHNDASRMGAVKHTSYKWQFPYFPNPADAGINGVINGGGYDPEDLSRTKDYNGQPKNSIIGNGVVPPYDPLNPDPALGLDNALPGDIVTITMNGLPHVYYVTKLGWPVDIKEAQAKWNYLENKYQLPNGNFIRPDRVYVESWDQGKFPTSTGSSMHWGYGPERTIYKYFVPENYREEICSRKLRLLTDFSDYLPGTPPSTQCRTQMRDTSQVFSASDCMNKKCQPSCADLDYSTCVLPNGADDWRRAKVYRPAYDVRRCSGAITFPVPDIIPNATDFSLDATYNWYAPPIDPAKPTEQKSVRPSLNVIYQAQTSEVGTDLWAFCHNGGFDPPQHFAREYKGPQTGALTDITLCGPKWGDCRTAKPYERKCFPTTSGDECPRDPYPFNTQGIDSIPAP